MAVALPPFPSADTGFAEPIQVFFLSMHPKLFLQALGSWKEFKRFKHDLVPGVLKAVPGHVQGDSNAVPGPT